jgi:hypothetical protein
MQLHTIGIDLGKTLFHLVGLYLIHLRDRQLVWETLARKVTQRAWLCGLRENKLKWIRSFIKFLAGMDAIA